MKRKILLTGATGLFGSAFISKNYKNDNFKIFGVSRNVNTKKLYPSVSYISEDIKNKKRILGVINEIKPDVIIHTASIGSVDYCETHRKEAWETNVVGNRNIIDGAKLTQSILIFLSTNAVYDGVNPLYDEKSQVNPVDYYGKTKVTSELDVAAEKINWVIVRLMTMYGWHDKNQRYNPVTWIIDELRNNHKINIVDDIYNNHLYVGQAVEAILQIIKLQKWSEVYNIAGRDCISRYQLALEVADIFSLDKKLINPVKSSFFQTLAPRPKNTCFNTGKMEKELQVTPLSVRDGLKLMINEKQ